MLFEPTRVKSYQFKNKIIMAPMCMYQSDNTGVVKPFHEAHYMSHAMGGVSMVIVEATAIDPNGRISTQDLGIWDDTHIKGLKTLVSRIHEGGAYAGIQINHAGRKARVDDTIGPSALPFRPDDKVPKAMTLSEIKDTIQQFKNAAKRADAAGFDALEIHGAHGYLISQFMSPISNQRTDAYGKPHQFLKDVLDAVLEVWPKNKILTLRVSGTEYHPEGFDVDDIIHILRHINVEAIDYIHVSSGANVIPQTLVLKPGYQLPLAQKIKHALNVKTIGGGLIEDHIFADEALKNQQCDLVFFGRLLLRDPMYFLRVDEHAVWPAPYKRGKK